MPTRIHKRPLKLCKIEGCNKKYYAKGLCQKHYNKVYMLEYYKQWRKENKKHLIKYRQDNKEKITKQTKQWCQEHKEYCAKSDKQYRKERKEHYLALWRKYRKTHKKERAEHGKKYREKNKEKIAKYIKQWKQTLIGKISLKADCSNRRALTKDLTKAIVQRVYEDNIKKYGVLTCYLCFNPIVNNDDSLDHSIPLIRKGTNDYKNLGIAHLNCNLKKYTMTLDEWFEREDNIKKAETCPF